MLRHCCSLNRCCFSGCCDDGGYWGSTGESHSRPLGFGGAEDKVVGPVELDSKGDRSIELDVLGMDYCRALM